MDISKVYLTPYEQDPVRQNSVIRQLVEYISSRSIQRPITSSSTIGDGDGLVTFNTTSATQVTLPPSMGRTMPITFKDIGGNAGVANISINPASTNDLIDGSTGYWLVSPYQSVTIYPFAITNQSSLSGWFVS